MGNEVYANSMEVSCKAAQGKSICAMPDVCFTPPMTPATPPGVPIPYPNTGMASDATEGSKTVQISGQEVMLKNKSYFKQSTGDEAGSAPKKAVITSQIKGKVYFNAWSMDVKFEGENVVRNLDLTTHNHSSFPGNTPTWPYLDAAAVKNQSGPCSNEIKEEQDKCGTKPADNSRKRKAEDGGPAGQPPIKRARKEDGAAATSTQKDPCAKIADKPTSKEEAIELTKKTEADDCLKARRCMLVPYQPTAGQAACCPGQTGHHMVEAGSFFKKGRGVDASDREYMLKVAKGMTDDGDYEAKNAPCICVEGANQYHGTHGLMHTFQGNAALKNGEQQQVLLQDDVTIVTLLCQKYGQARDSGATAGAKVFPGCTADCFKAQLDNYHNPKKGQNPGDRENEWVRSIVTGYTKDEDVTAATRVVANGLKNFSDTGTPVFRGII